MDTTAKSILDRAQLLASFKAELERRYVFHPNDVAAIFVRYATEEAGLMESWVELNSIGKSASEESFKSIYSKVGEPKINLDECIRNSRAYSDAETLVRDLPEKEQMVEIKKRRDDFSQVVVNALNESMNSLMPTIKANKLLTKLILKEQPQKAHDIIRFYQERKTLEELHRFLWGIVDEENISIT